MTELVDWLTALGHLPPSSRLEALYVEYGRRVGRCGPRCACEVCFVGYDADEGAGQLLS